MVFWSASRPLSTSQYGGMCELSSFVSHAPPEGSDPAIASTVGKDMMFNVLFAIALPLLKPVWTIDGMEKVEAIAT